jgi:hypothetical protein
MHSRNENSSKRHQNMVQSPHTITQPLTEGVNFDILSFYQPSSHFKKEKVFHKIKKRSIEVYVMEQNVSPLFLTTLQQILAPLSAFALLRSSPSLPNSLLTLAWRLRARDLRHPHSLLRITKQTETHCLGKIPVHVLLKST